MSEEMKKSESNLESQGVDEENRALHECMQCGASIAAESEFCRVCGVELSGGHWEGEAAADQDAIE
jgi:ribosomal protein L40E